MARELLRTTKRALKCEKREKHCTEQNDQGNVKEVKADFYDLKAGKTGYVSSFKEACQNV